MTTEHTQVLLDNHTYPSVAVLCCPGNSWGCSAHYDDACSLSHCTCLHNAVIPYTATQNHGSSHHPKEVPPLLPQSSNHMSSLMSYTMWWRGCFLSECFLNPSEEYKTWMKKNRITELRQHMSGLRWQLGPCWCEATNFSTCHEYCKCSIPSLTLKMILQRRPRHSYQPIRF